MGKVKNSKYTIEDMKRFAKTHGGTCLSKKYSSMQSKLLWRCSKGHEWETSPRQIIRGHWCFVCGSGKRSLADMIKFAKTKGGFCHSKVYKNSDIKLEWECAKGHRFFANFTVISSGRWCLECKEIERKAAQLKEIKKIALKRKGICLSEEYINSDSKLEFQCQFGHKWSAIPYNITVGVWCPTCGGSERLSIALMKKIAKEKGGFCLSEVYTNARTVLRWRCKNGHEWNASGGSVRNGTWCKICARSEMPRKFTIEQMQKIANDRNGKCLSTGSFTVKEKLKWQCKDGHIWFAEASSVIRGTWCNKCADKDRADKKRYNINQIRTSLGKMKIELLSDHYQSAVIPLDLQCKVCNHKWQAKWGNLVSGYGCPRCAKKVVYWEDIDSKVKSKHGKLISTKFISAKSKLDLVCANNHKFQSTWDQLLRGSWCPYCPASLGERLCKLYFEHLFQCEFPKLRPKWLKVKNHRGTLELDGFNQDLKLAFEHHGKQHFTPGTLFSKGSIDFKERKRLDKLKRKLCKENGVTLIEIPEVPSMLPIEDLLSFILNKLARSGISPLVKDLGSIDLKPAFITSLKKLEALKEIAELKGGLCLSDSYINSGTKLTWQCGQGHIWDATPNSIKNNGGWCPECAAYSKNSK